MPYPVMPLGFLGSQGDEDSYRIERSLRFNSADSAYLNRTPASAGNRKTWTWSGWVKRGAIGTAQTLFSCGTAANNTGQMAISFLQGANLDSLRIHGYSVNFRVTTMQFRDPSAWYHIVVAIDSTNVTASDRIKFYVNGSEITSFITSTDLALNTDYGINQALQHGIGRYEDGASSFLNGYLTEVNFIDGQALTPSSFGETDPITGRWKAKAYSGTYGTNGFYLKFADNSGTTATTLGKDSSGNGNNWTPNNFSVTAGVGNDSLVDSPTNYGTDTGVGGEVRGNYATLNPLTGNSTLVDGNLRPSTTGVGLSTIGMSSGKWYCEQTVIAVGTTSDIGIHTGTGFNTYVGSTSSGYSYQQNGNKYNNASASAYGATYTSGDIIGCAFDADAGELSFYKNGVSQGVAFTGLTSVPYFFGIYGRSAATANNVYINFGQRPFAYTAPSGFKALCTTNLPIPTIQKPSRYMDVVTYTGNGSASQDITGLSFSPDLVWLKSRTDAYDHRLKDSTRGNSVLFSNLTNAESAYSLDFLSNGIRPTLAYNDNISSKQYVAWAWDEAPIAGMDIVSYTGTGVAGRTVAHSLGVAPKMVIVKSRNDTQNWWVYHSSQNASPANGALLLNSTAAFATDSNYWNNTNPTSSVFSVGTYHASGNNYIAYLFAEVEGFSKFGSFTGVASADGPFVYCGFSPKYVLYKSATGIADWQVCDSSRDTFNPVSYFLRPNASNAEAVSATLDFASNGFKLRASTTAGATFIFAAFAESPFKYARAR